MAEDAPRDRAALRSEIARSRDRVRRELGALRYELDFPRKVKDSIRAQPAVWVGAVILGGMLVAALVTRKKRTVHVDRKGETLKEEAKLLQAGALIGALRFVVPLLRPFVVKFVAGKVRDYARRHR